MDLNDVDLEDSQRILNKIAKIKISNFLRDSPLPPLATVQQTLQQAAFSATLPTLIAYSPYIFDTASKIKSTKPNIKDYGDAKKMILNNSKVIIIVNTQELFCTVLGS